MIILLFPIIQKKFNFLVLGGGGGVWWEKNDFSFSAVYKIEIELKKIV